MILVKALQGSLAKGTVRELMTIVPHAPRGNAVHDAPRHTAAFLCQADQRQDAAVTYVAICVVSDIAVEKRCVGAMACRCRPYSIKAYAQDPR